jgi:hypothetical protein
MHFKNGREAKAGDVVVFDGGKYNAAPKVGVLHSLIPGADSCNGRIAEVSSSDALITINECLHIDDLKAAAIADSTKKPAEG